MDSRTKKINKPAKTDDPLAGKSKAFKAALDAVARIGRAKAVPPDETGEDRGGVPDKTRTIQRDVARRSPGDGVRARRGGASGLCS